MKKTNRNFSIDKDLSDKLNSSIPAIEEIRSFKNFEKLSFNSFEMNVLMSSNVSHLVNVLLNESMRQVERFLENLKSKKIRSL